MENSEKKSLKSTGSSNLAKTEKLLSITQKILSEIKLQYESVRIGNQEWITRNLVVDRFRNGDLIPHIESKEEWEEAGENGQPAWCYFNNNPEYRKKYGKLYNWFAVNDSRGLAPKGWHIPSNEEWNILQDFLGDDEGYKMKSVEGWEEREDKDGKIQNGNGDNSSGFNVLPGGNRSDSGSFLNIRDYALFWSATDLDYTSAWTRFLFDFSGNLYRFNGRNKSVGASVRCLRD
jgi:uncharacterized protein (TIGR02145 family)